MDNGGPAFPQSKDSWFYTSDAGVEIPTGMTLRDYFAAKAMQSIILADGIQFAGSVDFHAKAAYEQADAMLKAREK